LLEDCCRDLTAWPPWAPVAPQSLINNTDTYKQLLQAIDLLRFADQYRPVPAGWQSLKPILVAQLNEARSDGRRHQAKAAAPVNRQRPRSSTSERATMTTTGESHGAAESGEIKSPSKRGRPRRSDSAPGKKSQAAAAAVKPSTTNEANTEAEQRQQSGSQLSNGRGSMSHGDSKNAADRKNVDTRNREINLPIPVLEKISSVVGCLSPSDDLPTLHRSVSPSNGFVKVDEALVIEEDTADLEIGSSGTDTYECIHGGGLDLADEETVDMGQQCYEVTTTTTQANDAGHEAAAVECLWLHNAEPIACPSAVQSEENLGSFGVEAGGLDRASEVELVDVGLPSADSGRQRECADTAAVAAASSDGPYLSVDECSLPVGRTDEVPVDCSSVPAITYELQLDGAAGAPVVDCAPDVANEADLAEAPVLLEIASSLESAGSSDKMTVNSSVDGAEQSTMMSSEVDAVTRESVDSLANESHLNVTIDDDAAEVRNERLRRLLGYKLKSKIGLGTATQCQTDAARTEASWKKSESVEINVASEAAARSLPASAEAASIKSRADDSSIGSSAAGTGSASESDLPMIRKCLIRLRPCTGATSQTHSPGSSEVDDVGGMADVAICSDDDDDSPSVRECRVKLRRLRSSDIVSSLSECRVVLERLVPQQEALEAPAESPQPLTADGGDAGVGNERQCDAESEAPLTAERLLSCVTKPPVNCSFSVRSNPGDTDDSGSTVSAAGGQCCKQTPDESTSTFGEQRLTKLDCKAVLDQPAFAGEGVETSHGDRTLASGCLAAAKRHDALNSGDDLLGGQRELLSDQPYQIDGKVLRTVAGTGLDPLANRRDDKSCVSDGVRPGDVDGSCLTKVVEPLETPELGDATTSNDGTDEETNSADRRVKAATVAETATEPRGPINSQEAETSGRTQGEVGNGDDRRETRTDSRSAAVGTREDGDSATAEQQCASPSAASVSPGESVCPSSSDSLGDAASASVFDPGTPNTGVERRSAESAEARTPVDQRPASVASVATVKYRGISILRITQYTCMECTFGCTVSSVADVHRRVAHGDRQVIRVLYTYRCARCRRYTNCRNYVYDHTVHHCKQAPGDSSSEETNESVDAVAADDSSERASPIDDGAGSNGTKMAEGSVASAEMLDDNGVVADIRHESSVTGRDEAADEDEGRRFGACDDGRDGSKPNAVARPAEVPVVVISDDDREDDNENCENAHWLRAVGKMPRHRKQVVGNGKTSGPSSLKRAAAETTSDSSHNSGAAHPNQEPENEDVKRRKEVTAETDGAVVVKRTRGRPRRISPRQARLLGQTNTVEEQIPAEACNPSANTDKESSPAAALSPLIAEEQVSADADAPKSDVAAVKSNRKRLQTADGADVDSESESQMGAARSRSSKLDRKRGADVETVDKVPRKRRSSSASVAAPVENENEPANDGDRPLEKAADAAPAAILAAAGAGDDVEQPSAVGGTAAKQWQDSESAATGAVSPAKSSSSSSSSSTSSFMCIDCRLPCRSYTEYNYHRSTSHCRWKPASSIASSAAGDDRESISSDEPPHIVPSSSTSIKDARSCSGQAAAVESAPAVKQAQQSVSDAPAAAQVSSLSAAADADADAVNASSTRQMMSGVQEAMETHEVGDRQSSAATRERSKREMRLSTQHASAASSSSACAASRRRRSTDQRRGVSSAATQGQRSVTAAPPAGGSSRNHRASIK
jgi:hypothetical protein